MLESIDPITLARRYHDALPLGVRDYLNHRGVTDEVINVHLLGWDGKRITIPIFDRDGRPAFFRLAKDPADTRQGPKMLAPAGSSAELYGWERLRVKPPRIVICEGEFDRLVLESRGIAAVTSTGGAAVFRNEWAQEFHDIPEVFVCFDRDDAGAKGARRVATLIPRVRVAKLPEEVGDGGDVTDYFVRLGHNREDFLTMLASARPLSPEEIAPAGERRQPGPRAGNRREVEDLKGQVLLEDLVARTVPLSKSGSHLRGRCPFHDDETPSFVVYPQNQTFHCFGCQAHGDVLTFLMRVENLTFHEALERLRDLART
jgi:CHC2 zinc finger/Toprim-like